MSPTSGPVRFYPTAVPAGCMDEDKQMSNSETKTGDVSK